MIRSTILVLAILAASAEALADQPGMRPSGRPFAGEAEAGRQNWVAQSDERPRVPVVGNRVRVTAPEMGLYRVAGSVLGGRTRSDHRHKSLSRNWRSRRGSGASPDGGRALRAKHGVPHRRE
jgi:hypothetical protein